MARIYLSKNFKAMKTEDLPSTLDSVFNDLQQQVNGGPAIFTLLSNKDPSPKGLQSGDIVFDATGTTLKIGVFNGKVIVY